jgi:hypothetical protein
MAPAIACKTTNRKTGPVNVTHASQASCPKDCPFYGQGCYAEEGVQAFVTRRLNRAPERRAERIARREARAIGALKDPTKPLRLHIVGDARTDRAARILATAARQYSGPVWSYTHAWRRVARSSWGSVSVLASCETVSDVLEARTRGYAAALVVDRMPERTEALGSELAGIPCPAQTRDLQCIDCRLCFRDQALLAGGRVILFEAHGSGARKVRAALKGAA